MTIGGYDSGGLPAYNSLFTAVGQSADTSNSSLKLRSPWSRTRRTPPQLLLRYYWHYGKFVSDVHDKLIGRIFRMKV